MTKVLIADDSELMLRLTEIAIHQLDETIEVIEVKNGQDALEQWCLEQPDLCVLDIHMPRINGIEVLREIKRQDPHAKVLMLTADRHEHIEHACRELGVDMFVKKSENRPIIQRAFRAMLKQADQAMPLHA